MRLHEQVRFESPTTTTDEYRRSISGWTEEFTTKADYRRLRGSEAAIGARLQGKQLTVLTIRNSTKAREIKPTWRAVNTRTGETFNVYTNIETDDRQFREITAESGVSV